MPAPCTTLILAAVRGMRTRGTPAPRTIQARAYPRVNSARQFSLTSTSRYPRKDSQDRDSINTEATEYSKSGTDDGAARQEEAAFDPGNTKPEEELKKAGEGEVRFFPSCSVCFDGARGMGMGWGK